MRDPAVPVDSVADDLRGSVLQDHRCRRGAEAGAGAADRQRLYAAAAQGQAEVPWDAPHPSALLVEWATSARAGTDRGRALVVGCGLGRDAEYISSLGFDTVAFDVSDTAVQGARERHPASTVEYVAADLFSPPPEWCGAFDFVFENMTIQSLPPDARGLAIINVGAMIAPGGTLLVVAWAWVTDAEPPDGPPWPLPRSELDAFAIGDAETVQVEDIADPADPDVHRWRAEFRRPMRDRPMRSARPSH